MFHTSKRFALPTVAALVLSTVGVAVLGGVAQPALAVTTPAQNFTTPGSYVVTVPPTASSVHLNALGGAGEAGGTAPSNDGDGGVGGHGDRATEDVAIGAGSVIQPRSTFTVTVGAMGGGGAAGNPITAFGAPFAGAGGKGGAATWITAQNGTVLIVAGGGGGGGGGGNGSPGGAGGTQGPGQATSIGGVIAAKGGDYGGFSCPAGADLGSYPGQDGETTTTQFSLGGAGGGAGGGFCGGLGGGSGDHGSGASNDGGGGGGGGSGGYGYYPQATGNTYASGTNTGDGSASITFDVAPATATLSSTSIDFGTQTPGTTSAPGYVTVTNNGGVPLTLNSLGAAGADPGDFGGTFGTCPQPLPPQASCQLGATFTPTATGPRSATLVLYDSAADSPQSITLTGNPAPATATLSATSIDFGTQTPGTTSTAKFVTLTNDGDVPLINNGLSLSGGGVNSFDGDTGTCGDTIPAHSSCQVGAIFHPTDAAPWTTTLVINDSAADSPQTITLTGNPAPATATLSATSIDYGTQALGTTSAPGYVTVTNDGALPMTLDGLGASGADPGDFSGTFGNCPQSLAPQASCKLGATFTPTAAGLRTATLQVYDSAPDSPQSITLTGNPAPATATLSATSIDFGTQTPGTTSAAKFVTLTNNGDVPLINHGLSLTGGRTSGFDGDTGTCPDDIIAAHSSCQFGAIFHPTDATPWTATLTISDSAADSPQTITLTGNPAPATATLSATSIDYGTQALGTTSAPGYVTVTNDGGQPMTLYGLGASGADLGDFSGTFGNCPQSLAPQASCKLGAAFTPTAAGLRTATLQVYDSAPDSPQSIALTGTGVTTPAAPAIGAATAGDARATVAFTAPTSDGGAAVTGYTATAQDVTHPTSGGQTATGTTSPLTVTGLTNGDQYTFTTTATNSAGTSPASAASNPVTPVAPVVPLVIATHSPLPGGTVGIPYTVTLTATGGTSPYTWSLATGSTLPAGLTLHPNGTLTGTPTAAGSRSLTVRVTDAAAHAQTASTNLTLTINPAPKLADLAVSLTHTGRFVTGHDGWYRVQVTNTGTAATTHPTTVSTTLPRGLTPVWAAGSGWTCASHGQTGSCTHTGAIAAHQSSTILVLVRITATAGTVLSTSMTVAPTDATPADNTSTDRVLVDRR